MKKILLCTALVLTACNNKSENKEPEKVVSFQCGDDTVDVAFMSDKAVINMDDQKLEIPKVYTTTGKKYELDGPDGYIMFWDKGNESSFEYRGQTFPPCLPL